MSTRPAVFLDRDGTVIYERQYLADPGGVELLPGAGRALKAFADAGYALVIVTNQSGIARGLYTDAAFHAVQRRVEDELAQQGVHLDGVFYCPHHPEYTGPCDCRKPALAMYREASARLGLDLGRSLYIGDRLHDASPATALGGRGYLVSTGHGTDVAEELPVGVFRAADLIEIARREGIFPIDSSDGRI